MEASDSVVPLRNLFAMNVRTARVCLGYTQHQVAEACGLDRTYIGGVERGERNITVDNVDRIAEALGYSASELLQPDFRPSRFKQPARHADLIGNGDEVELKRGRAPEVVRRVERISAQAELRALTELLEEKRRADGASDQQTERITPSPE